jgi:hypothetical protein
MAAENNIKQIIQSVKDSEETKLILKSKMNDFKELNTGTRAELSKKLMVDMVVFEQAIEIMGEGLNEAEIEIECLEAKNAELEKELKLTEEDKERMNKFYFNKKIELQIDGNKNERVMRRLNNIMSRSRQLTQN